MVTDFESLILTRRGRKRMNGRFMWMKRSEKETDRVRMMFLNVMNDENTQK